MIIIILTIITVLIVCISLYYINNIQKQAEFVTKKEIEHMANLKDDSGSNLKLLLSKDYVQQFVKEGIKNINSTKIIENGVIKGCGNFK